MRSIFLGILCTFCAVVATAQIIVEGSGVPQGIPAGSSIWYGNSAPASSVGANGDFYVNTSSYCLYGPKAAGAWPSACVSSVRQLGYVAENVSNRGTPGGYAGLDGTGMVPLTNLPAVTAVNGTSLPSNSSSDQTVVTTAPSIGSWVSLPSCPDAGGSHLNYSQTTHSFLCGNTGGTAGSVAFSGVGNGTNAGSLLISGSLGYTGGGVVNANQLGGVSLAGLTSGLLKIASGTPGTAAPSDVTAALGFTPENFANKNVPNGYAPLNASGLVPAANLPAITSINGTTLPTNNSSDQTVVTTSPSVGSWTALPSCPDTGGNHLNYSLVTHGFVCGNTGGTAGSVQFGGVGNGTNANALIVSGTLGYTGSGLINANQLGGVTLSTLSTGLLKNTNGTGIPTIAASGDITTTLGFTPESTGNKNAANGYAPLDANKLLPVANLPVISSVSGTSIPGNSASDQTILTTATAAGAWVSLPSCADSAGSHLNYSVVTHGFLCGSSVGAVSFSGVGNGTNPNSLLISGSLGYTGIGQVSANLLSGVPLAGLATGLLKNTNGTGAPSIASSADNNSTLGYSPENTANKNAPNGYAPLDTNGLLPGANLPRITTVNGTSVPANNASDQTVVTTAAATGAWASLPACPDSAGSHLNYSTATHTFACGSTAGTASNVGFGGVTTGTNSNALLISGSLGYTGSGQVNANQLGGVYLAGLSTGLLKNTNGDGAPSIAASADVTSTLGFTPENTANKNAAYGYAPLDSNKLLPAANLPTITAVNGTNIPANSSSDQTVVTTAATTGSWASLPSCLDSGGSHLNYSTTTHSFLCGSTSSGGSTVQFSGVSSGINAGALLVSGSLGYTGGGQINANQLSGVSLAGLSTGLLKNTTGTGTPSIAASADVTSTLGYTAAPLDSNGLLPVANLPTAAVTSTSLSNNTLTGGLVGLTTTSDITAGGNLWATSNVYANNTGSTAGCLHLSDSNGVHDMGICAPSSGFNGLMNLWPSAGADGQYATSDGSNNLLWSSYWTMPHLTGLVTFAPPAATSGTPTLFAATAPAHTGLTAGTEANDFYFNLNRTVQFTGGTTIPIERAVLFSAPAYSFTTGPTTITTTSTVAVTGPPAAGTNATLSNSATLWLQGGATSGTAAYGLLAYAPTGATRNFAAYLNGNVSIGSGSGPNAGSNTLFVQGPSTGNTSLTVEASTSTPGSPLFQVLNSSGATEFSVDSGFNVNLIAAAGTSAPHVNRAGSTNADAWGRVQLASGTATVTFTTAYGNTPVCVANDTAHTHTIQAAPSTSNVVFTSSTGTDTDIIAYICFGNPN